MSAEDSVPGRGAPAAAAMLLVAVWLVAACRQEVPAGGKEAHDNARLTGTWHVTTAAGDTKEMRLVQAGDAFTGETDAGTVTGRIDGPRMTIELEGGSARGTGSVTGDFMEGEYETTEEGRSGRWEATRDRAR